MFTYIGLAVCIIGVVGFTGLVGIYLVSAFRVMKRKPAAPQPKPQRQVPLMMQAYAEGRKLNPRQAATDAVIQIVKNALGRG